MHEDKEFAIDKNSESYRLLKPTERAAWKDESEDEGEKDLKAPT
jgi:hypothetical protein